MAKKAMINKELRREKLVAAGKYPAVRLHNRCSICGRPHGYHRDFGLCRICLRKMAHQGLLPGVTKASWQCERRDQSATESKVCCCLCDVKTNETVCF